LGDESIAGDSFQPASGSGRWARAAAASSKRQPPTHLKTGGPPHRQQTPRSQTLDLRYVLYVRMRDGRMAEVWEVPFDQYENDRYMGRQSALFAQITRAPMRDRYLVIGGSGRTGRHVVDRLLDGGKAVRS